LAHCLTPLSLIRVWFCLTITSGPSIMMAVLHQKSITNPELLNADNVFTVRSNGLYRFDIPATADDTINLRCIDKEVSTIRLLRFEKILFGA